MCGFAGFLSVTPLDRSKSSEMVTKMCDAISHRGPDDSGIWSDPECHIVLGHRRLSIMDVSERGAQPMRSVSNRWVLAFNGEIYNHLQIRAYLEDQSIAPKWRGHSDTETLLAGFDALGLDKMLSLCVGMFSIVVWDSKSRELTMIRDRFGEKPLYYGWTGSGQNKCLLFGSDIFALKRHDSFDFEISRNALSQFVRYGYVGNEQSIFSGIKKVGAGSLVTISLKSSEDKITKYWSASDLFMKKPSEKFIGDFPDAVEAVHRQLSQTVQSQMLADVPLGSFLSGGVDSSLITALMQETSKSPINTFSIGFDDHAFNEANYAKAVADHLGTHHTELYVSSSDVRDIVPRMASVYSEPFADSSQLPSYLVSALAGEHVKVALSGDAGDEVFCGYNRYHIAKSVWPRLEKLPGKARSFIGSALLKTALFNWDRFSGLTNQSRLGDKIYKVSQVIGSDDVKDLYQNLCSQWHDPDSVVLGTTGPSGFIFADISPEVMDSVEYMMACDSLTYLPGDILVKVDRASMANSLETRTPFLDHRLVELAWSLPIGYKLRGGHTKAPLREILAYHVPRHLIERPKMGFAIPIGSWLRSELREWAEDLLREDRLISEGFFNPLPIRKIWNEHTQGKYNHEHKLWNILMFQSWLEEWRK